MQLFAAGEGPLADLCDVLRQPYSGKRGAAIEYPIRQPRERVAAEADAGKSFAVGKGKITQGFQRRRQLQLHQRAAEQECALADGRDAVLHVRQGQIGTAGEGAAADRFQRIRQIDLFKRAAGLKGVVADGFNALRHMHFLQAEQPCKASVADGGDIPAVQLRRNSQTAFAAGIVRKRQRTILVDGPGVVLCCCICGNNRRTKAQQQRQHQQHGQQLAPIHLSHLYIPP